MFETVNCIHRLGRRDTRRCTGCGARQRSCKIHPDLSHIANHLVYYIRRYHVSLVVTRSFIALHVTVSIKPGRCSSLGRHEDYVCDDIQRRRRVRFSIEPKRSRCHGFLSRSFAVRSQFLHVTALTQAAFWRKPSRNMQRRRWLDSTFRADRAAACLSGEELVVAPIVDAQMTPTAESHTSERTFNENPI